VLLMLHTVLQGMGLEAAERAATNVYSLPHLPANKEWRAADSLQDTSLEASSSEHHRAAAGQGSLSEWGTHGKEVDTPGARRAAGATGGANAQDRRRPGEGEPELLHDCTVKLPYVSLSSLREHC
jgi:hypothetical protein